MVACFLLGARIEGLVSPLLRQRLKQGGRTQVQIEVISQAYSEDQIRRLVEAACHDASSQPIDLLFLVESFSNSQAQLNCFLDAARLLQCKIRRLEIVSQSPVDRLLSKRISNEKWFQLTVSPGASIDSLMAEFASILLLALDPSRMDPVSGLSVVRGSANCNSFVVRVEPLELAELGEKSRKLLWTAIVHCAFRYSHSHRTQAIHRFETALRRIDEGASGIMFPAEFVANQMAELLTSAIESVAGVVELCELVSRAVLQVRSIECRESLTKVLKEMHRLDQLTQMEHDPDVNVTEVARNIVRNLQFPFRAVGNFGIPSDTAESELIEESLNQVLDLLKQEVSTMLTGIEESQLSAITHGSASADVCRYRVIPIEYSRDTRDEIWPIQRRAVVVTLASNSE